MTADQALAAFRELAALPAAEWTGSKIVEKNRVMIQCCMRCGNEARFELPPIVIRTPADVPEGLDEKLFAWKIDFLKKHETCEDHS